MNSHNPPGGGGNGRAPAPRRPAPPNSGNGIFQPAPGYVAPPLHPPAPAPQRAQSQPQPAAQPQPFRPAAPSIAPQPGAPQRPAGSQSARPSAPPLQRPASPPPSRPQQTVAAIAPPARPTQQQQQPQRPVPPPTSQPAAQPSTPAPHPAPANRAVPGAGDPYPPLQHPGALGGEMRTTPRSARAAIQPEHVPMPTRRSHRARHPFVIAGNLMLTLLFLLTVGAGIAFVVGKQRFEEPGPLAENKVVNVPRGGMRDTAELLAREGVIDQPWLFVAGATLMKARDDLKYGEYQFRKNASLRDVIDTLMEGKVVQHAFTVAEGLTSDQIVARLIENPVLTGNIREIPREGTLLPETYRFTRGTSREEMIKRMQAAQRRAVQEAWDRRNPDLPIRSPEQLVTLASIVEKETGKPEERTRVAAVFVNRLKQKMRLESDPTIIYGLVGGKGALGRPIMASEIRQPTPYNTYVIDGLPPGPIANPGRASLEAAVNPARTKELFFVADGTGGHAFSENYEQHKRNVEKLRVLERQASPQAEAPPPTAKPPARPRNSR